MGFGRTAADAFEDVGPDSGKLRPTSSNASAAVRPKPKRKPPKVLPPECSCSCTLASQRPAPPFLQRDRIHLRQPADSNPGLLLWVGSELWPGHRRPHPRDPDCALPPERRIDSQRSAHAHRPTGDSETSG